MRCTQDPKVGIKIAKQADGHARAKNRKRSGKAIA